MPPQSPTMGDAAAPITPEQLAELQHKLGLVKNGYSKWQSMKFASQNRVQEVRRAKLRELFQLLASKGVDLTNQKSISDFMTKLRQENPKQYEIVSRALDYLLSSHNEKFEPGATAPTSPAPASTAPATA